MKERKKGSTQIKLMVVISHAEAVVLCETTAKQIIEDENEQEVPQNLCNKPFFCFASLVDCVFTHVHLLNNFLLVIMDLDLTKS